MPRYIDAEALEELINDTCKYAKATNDYQRGCNEVVDWFEKIIKNTSTADVVSRSEVEEIVKFKDMAYAELKSLFIEAKQEVAKQIFEEIHKEIELALDSNYKARREHNNFISLVDGKISALRGIDDFVYELQEKKYIGE